MSLITYLTDCISHEYYASDSFHMTKDSKYSDLFDSVPRGYGQYLHFRFWEIPCLGNNTRHNTRG